MIANKEPMRLDANEYAFFLRELECIKSKTYDTKYKKLKAKTLIPVSTECSGGTTEITWRSYSGVGYAKIIADYAKDFPRVDIFGEENTVKIHAVGGSYGYSIDEIRASQLTGKSLDQRRANMVRRAIEEKIDDIAWTGDPDYNIQGFIDYPGITQYTVPDPGSGTEWVNKTPDEIIVDMSGIVSAVVDTTNGVEAPDTMIMPISQYVYIANTRMTGDSDRTIMKFFMENNPFIKMIDWVVELKGAGASATDKFMVYTKDENNLTFEIPQPFEQFTPQQRGLEFEIMAREKTAGIIVYYPLSVAYGDGI